MAHTNRGTSMSESLWRVKWLIDSGKGPQTSCEFTSEKKAMDWAAGLLKAGAKSIFVTELILGRSVHIDALPPSLPFQK